MSTDNAGEGLREAVEALICNNERTAPVTGSAVDAGISAADRAWRHDLRRILAEHPATPAEAECKCPPCPGRGKDGHGMTHCAECCWGTGVEAEPGCPTHYPLPAEPDAGDADGLSLPDEPDNHHNADACPYCQPRLATREREAEQRGAEKAWDEGWRAGAGRRYANAVNPYRTDATRSR